MGLSIAFNAKNILLYFKNRLTHEQAIGKSECLVLNQFSYSSRIFFARRPAQSHSFGAVPGFPLGNLWTTSKTRPLNSKISNMFG
jgi:hypothetical protein